jgi:NDP-sugar pyrophosphorylase family protein
MFSYWPQELRAGNFYLLEISFKDTPKCLIKVANKPILAYQLEFLERNKLNEVIIITNKKFYQKISDYLNEEYRG